MSRIPRPTIAFFPEASFGAALNCVAMAQALQERGARPVFITHPGFSGVFAGYGFLELPLNTPAAMSASEQQNTWQAFVEKHLPHFDQTPFEQIDSYVAPTWEAIVNTVIDAEAPLTALLSKLRPDAIVLDNVAMFPAVAQAGSPWIRVVSCAETELPDLHVPPYLSGLPAERSDERAAFEERYLRAVEPAHQRFNRFRVSRGLKPLPHGSFMETSPDLNMLLTPSIVRRERSVPLPPERFVYLEACVRREAPYDVPAFPSDEGPLVYVSFGSLGAMDTGLIARMIQTFAKISARFLVNVGGLRHAYSAVPDNVHLDSWYPQPSVLAKSDLFIHHGGNNSFCEALHFGVPSLIMPYCWDGHDNARRVVEVGAGLHLHRSDWREEDLMQAIHSLLADGSLKARLARSAEDIASNPGAEMAAESILSVLTR